MLAEGVSIGAPPHWNRIQGRGVVHHLLGIIIDTIEDLIGIAGNQDPGGDRG